MKKILVIAMLFCTNTVFAQSITEFCNDGAFEFNVISDNTTPREFLETDISYGYEGDKYQRPVAAINGTYYDAKGNPEGFVMRAGSFYNIKYFAYGSGEVRGYLYITDKGIFAGKMCPKELSDNDTSMFIIGTHPLLVSAGKISAQSSEKRYNYNEQGVQTTAYRSALGTKDGKHLCMVVSNMPMGMAQWALELYAHGYTQAINLDGGPVSQLACPSGTFGGGGANASTRSIFYFYKWHKYN